MTDSTDFTPTPIEGAIPCDACNGTGVLDDDTECTECDGLGEWFE